MNSFGLHRDRGIGAGLLLAFAVAVCARMPHIVLGGRFWAEEAQNFFHEAWVTTPWHALFNSYGGYLNIVANAATLTARWLMPLGLAPYLTIAVALFFQLCPILLLLTARDRWLQPVHAKALACLILLVVPASEEVWLQTLHSQFQLALCCVIILCLDDAAGRLGLARCLILFLAPLSGPVAIVVLPLFLLRLALERSRARLYLSAALTAGAALQLSLFFHPASRTYALTPAALCEVFTVKHLAVPFLGTGEADRFAAFIKSQSAAGRVPLAAIVLPPIVFAPFGLATLASARLRPACWLLTSGLLVAVASYFGALDATANLINPRTGERYAYVPQASFGLSVLATALTASGWASRAAFLVVAWLIVAGAIQFVNPWPMIAEGPSWRREIAIWRTDHAHPIRLWPQSWTVTLKADHTN